MRRSSCEAHARGGDGRSSYDGRSGRQGGRRSLMAEDLAVSEVLGYILSFGILAGILLLSLVGFNFAAQDTKDNIVELRAESITQRVAGVVIDMALLAESSGGDLSRFERTIELPDDIEGESYQLHLAADEVQLTMGDVTYTEPLLQAAQSTLFEVCPTPRSGSPDYVTGGTIRILYAAQDATPGSDTEDCGGTPSHFIVLEIPS